MNKYIYVLTLIVFLCLGVFIKQHFEYVQEIEEQKAECEQKLKTYEITEENLFNIMNAQRVAKGLKPLKLNEKLSNSATQKAMHMMEHHYWGHSLNDGLEGLPWNFILESGYKYEAAGENLAINFYTAEGVIAGWMGSPAHRENLLQKDFEEVGFGIVRGRITEKFSDSILVVQHFGKPVNSDRASARSTF